MEKRQLPTKMSTISLSRDTNKKPSSIYLVDFFQCPGASESFILSMCLERRSTIRTIGKINTTMKYNSPQQDFFKGQNAPQARFLVKKMCCRQNL